MPETTHLTGRDSRPRWIVVSAVLGLLILLGVGPALATATSGRIYRGTVGGHAICTEAIIRDVADNVANTTSWHYTNCYTPYSAPAGHIGVLAAGYRNGSLCDGTDWWYNSVPASGWGVGSVLCSNPPGMQVFMTGGWSKYWNGTGYTWLNPIYSPNQNY